MFRYALRALHSEPYSTVSIGVFENCKKLTLLDCVKNVEYELKVTQEIFDRAKTDTMFAAQFLEFCINKGNLSLNIKDKLCNTAQATTIVVEQTSLVVNPLDKQGNLRFQTL
ncbi:hypothetical protein KQX54_009214 [Cotesia glomerata]|uniref:Uncharacterized protein n=1 Tax=Cotesia glomerata TaxID=32391 RepID=A0AAV7IKY6_COTGL|nr:hypothetical protein KQX54_009214 [Cotesia glomerata]